jgi:hypothetical protein
MHKSSTAIVSDCISRIVRLATTPGLLHKTPPFIKTIRSHPQYWLTPEEDSYLDRVYDMNRRLQAMKGKRK